MPIDEMAFIHMRSETPPASCKSNRIVEYNYDISEDKQLDVPKPSLLLPNID